MNKTIWIVEERQGRDDEWSEVSYCATLEGAKNFIHSRSGPEFEQSKTGVIHVFASNREFMIREEKLTP